MKLSVVICTHAPKPELLERVVAALLPQVRTDPASELLIVDNGSPLAVAEMAAARSPLVQVVVEPRLGLTAARERAATEATGDVVIFVDDDNVLAADYLAVARDLMQDPSLGIVSGWVEPEYVVPPPSWVLDHEGALAIRRPHGSSVLVADGPCYSERFPIGAGMVIRRALLREYFDRSSRQMRIEGRRGKELLAGEDTDMAFFAISEGAKVGVCGRLRLRHVIPVTRTTEAYVVRLNRGALRSAVVVNAKWRGTFGRDVFPFLGESLWRTALRALLYSLLAFGTGFRVRAAAQWDMLALRARAPWT